MDNFIVNNEKFVIGMVHCLPLPGTPGYSGDFSQIIKQAVDDAVTLETGGIDALIVENMGDSPFTDMLNKSQIAALTAVAVAVKKHIHIPMGIDAAFNDCEASLSIAVATGADFVRIPVFVDTVLFTDGFIKPCANLCMKVKKSLHAEQIKILADIQVKHAYMVSPQITIEQSAKDAAANGADAIIVTGVSCGSETPIEIIERTKKVVKVPVIVASGVNAGNIKKQMEIADGCIVGSSLKKGSVLSNPIECDMVKELITALRGE